MNRLRNRLILIFLAATLAPLVATMLYTSSLLKLASLQPAADQVKTLSKSLLRTSKELYQRDSADLKAHAQRGEIEPRKFVSATHDTWPEPLRQFAASDDSGNFVCMFISAAP